MKFLLDTHIWYWLALGDERLGTGTRERLLREESELWLSPISSWELMLLVEKKRLELEPDAASWIRRETARAGFREALLNHEVAVTSRRIAALAGDPADRFLVATAHVYGLTLVTADRALIESREIPILANL